MLDGTVSASHLLTFKIYSKTSFSNPMAPKKNATNNSAVNQSATMPAQANPAIYPVATISIDVPSHPYDTRRKI